MGARTSSLVERMGFLGWLRGERAAARRGAPTEDEVFMHAVQVQAALQEAGWQVLRYPKGSADDLLDRTRTAIRRRHGGQYPTEYVEDWLETYVTADLFAEARQMVLPRLEALEELEAEWAHEGVRPTELRKRRQGLIDRDIEEGVRTKLEEKVAGWRSQGLSQRVIDLRQQLIVDGFTGKATQERRRRGGGPECHQANGGAAARCPCGDGWSPEYR
jgi:hypothetical protein